MDNPLNHHLVAALDKQKVSVYAELMKIIKNWQKKRAIGHFLNKLPTDLATAYGSKEFYSEGQIKTITHQKHYPSRYIGYAFVSFLAEQEAVNTIGNSELVRTLRQEVANLFFDGNINYVSTLAQKRKTGNSGHCSIDTGSSSVGD